MFIYCILLIIFYYLFKKYILQKIYSSKNINPLINNWLDIRIEALNRMKFSKQQNNILDLNNEGWHRYDKLINYELIYNYEYLKKNCFKCPKTTKLLEGIKNVKMAGFSWLQPKYKTEEYTNNNIGFDTYHLGLSVPENCILYVKQNENWKKYIEGNRTIIKFNDDNLHYSENNSYHDRVILYILIKK